MNLAAGTKIGQFTILKRIGIGPRSVVFAAEDGENQRTIALKLLPRALTFNAYSRDRLRVEIDKLMALNLQQVVPIFKIGQYREQVYIVMRLMAGGSFADRLGMGGIRPIHEIKTIFQTIAPTLDTIHQAGIVHGNLKPANFLFDATDQPLLTDFGLGQLATANSGLLRNNAARDVAYLSPETIEKGQLDSASDIYALGILLHVAAVGHHPFRAASPHELAMCHVNENVAKLGNNLDGVLQVALAKNSAERYPTVQALANAIPQTIEPTATPTKSWWQRLKFRQKSE